jgi:hypothetical protein
MIIEIKTIQEFHDAHVTIKITVDGQAEAAAIAQQLYTAEQVGDYQASEAELVAAPLRRQVAELERDAAYASGDWGQVLADAIQEVRAALTSQA